MVAGCCRKSWTQTWLMCQLGFLPWNPWNLEGQVLSGIGSWTRKGWKKNKHNMVSGLGNQVNDVKCSLPTRPMPAVWHCSYSGQSSVPAWGLGGKANWRWSDEVFRHFRGPPRTSKSSVKRMVCKALLDHTRSRRSGASSISRVRLLLGCLYQDDDHNLEVPATVEEILWNPIGFSACELL